MGTRERRQLLRARAVDERDGDDHDLRESPGANPTVTGRRARTHTQTTPARMRANAQKARHTRARTNARARASARPTTSSVSAMQSMNASIGSVVGSDAENGLKSPAYT